MIPLNLEKVRANARAAETEDLLDRVTVYRTGMETEALEILERELYERGLTPADIETHAKGREGRVLLDEEGVAQKCSQCHRPAVEEDWRWHRLWGWVPVFPRRMRWCERHAPEN